MVCTSPYPVYGYASKSNLYVPCGHCTACRIKRTSEWSLRLMNELPYWNNEAVFLTLTYDEEHLPKDYSLNRRDLQLFWKRLRKDLDCENRKIKYYACGEYGDTFSRPHYHSIVFGLRYNEEDRKLVKANWTLCDPLRFDYDNRSRKERGFAPVSPDDIRYVCGYVQKKYNGVMAEQVYGSRLPPFSVCSRGLGLEFAKENKERLENGEITFRGHNVSIPRYYFKKLGLKTNPINGFRHKVDYLAERGIDIKDIPPSQLTKFVNEKYEQLASVHLEQAERELRSRYEME